ncbi:hypothetical protein PGTUg99_018359 [Puccinia graminis f. sp. tritici]|uniref:Uncharacterized protein n=1 Tax=Puccinia graminis f. sp. tritici TaxID=56615 RepID=A0A5B0LK44_PUCGR|nr:hypothetical protein PGTUg99_018359 [Puccinia graminis f. sp. tritici]
MNQRSNDINSAERQSCDPTIDVCPMSNLEDRSGHCQAPQYSIGEGESGLGNDLANDYYSYQDKAHEPDEIDLDEIEWDPDFDLKNYSAEDVNCWASTLSADKFEHLRMMGPNARTESFQQYAVSNLNQPTQSITQQTLSGNDPLNQPNFTAIETNNNNNNFYQLRVNSWVDNFESNSYNNLDECNSQLEDTLDGSIVFDVGNGLIDGGGFFDDGTFDNGGFDDGGFDDDGFDNGGFDDGSFDDGGFDDGYGSSYY